MNEIDLAWVAGLIEGEGSITITRLQRRIKGEVRSVGYALCLSVTMTDEDCINILHTLFAGTKCIHHRGNDKKRRSWIWQVSSRRAGEVLDTLSPYFRSPRVQEKCALALKFQQQKSHGGRYIDGYAQKQEEFFATMRDLNVRGAANRKYVLANYPSDTDA